MTFVEREGWSVYLAFAAGCDISAACFGGDTAINCGAFLLASFTKGGAEVDKIFACCTSGCFVTISGLSTDSFAVDATTVEDGKAKAKYKNKSHYKRTKSKKHKSLLIENGSCGLPCFKGAIYVNIKFESW